jgi:hypothetical protein
MPEDVSRRLLDGASPPLLRTVVLGALTSIQLTGEIAADAARDLVSAGRRFASRERRPRVEG